MQKINTWEQTILLPPEQTRTGLGIAQNGVYLYPISVCCSQSFDKNKDASGLTRCNGDGCRNTASLLDTFATSARVSESGEGIRFFLEYWTGLSGDEFEIGVGSTA